VNTCLTRKKYEWSCIDRSNYYALAGPYQARSDEKLATKSLGIAAKTED